MNEKEVLFRIKEVLYCLGFDQFDDPLPGYRLELQMWEYPIIKRTEKGAWISLNPWFTFDDSHFQCGKRFVLLTAKKKYACPTKQEALESFIARKHRQIEIYEARLEQAKKALEKAKSITNVEDLK